MKVLNWPIPALLAWGSAWGCYLGLRHLGASETMAMLVATFCGGLLTTFGSTTMRRVLIVLGFPLSLVASSGSFAMPPWAWLVLLGLIVLL